jgi:hypothetical protein
VPTYENFDPTLFARIYVMMGNFRARAFAKESEMDAFWAPMATEVQRMRGVPPPPPVAPGNHVIDVDADTEMDGDEGSDWELGSGVDPEEDESETGGVQDEGGVDGVQGEGGTDGVQVEGRMDGLQGASGNPWE